MIDISPVRTFSMTAIGNVCTCCIARTTRHVLDMRAYTRRAARYATRRAARCATRRAARYATAAHAESRFACSVHDPMRNFAPVHAALTWGSRFPRMGGVAVSGRCLHVPTGSTMCGGVGAAASHIPAAPCAAFAPRSIVVASENHVKLASPLAASDDSPRNRSSQGRKLSHIVFISAIDVLKAAHGGLPFGNNARQNQRGTRTQIS